MKPATIATLIRKAGMWFLILSPWIVAGLLDAVGL